MLLCLFLQPLAAQWEIKHSNIDRQGYLRAIDFKDSQLGFAMGGDAALYRTEDAGESWAFMPVNLSVDIADFQFVGDSTMVAAGGENVILSSDLGSTWTMVYTEAEEDFQQLYFYNDSTAVLLGVAGIYRTVDQGLSWELVWSIEEEGYLFGHALELDSPADSLSFVSCIGLPGEGGNFQNFVLKSTDAGNTWTVQSSINDFLVDPHGLDFISRDTGCLGGEAGLLWGTTDQGQSWDSLTTLPFPIFDLQFTSSTTAFAAGSWLIGIPTFTPSGCVGRSTDGGLSWDTLITPRVPLYALYTADDSTAFVVGQHDIIMKYNPEIDGIAGDYPTDTEEEALPVNRLQLFPNPAHSQEVFLQVETAADQQLQLLLLDIHGRRLQQRTIQFILGENTVPLQLPSLASGTYFVQLRSGRAVRTLRLVVN
jgi:photosystem II stability/assembly factor-like uncharacterized protein